MKIGLKNTGILKVKINRSKLEKLFKEIVLKENKKLGEIQLVFLKDQEILKINREFLSHNYFTDVIAFEYNKKGTISGDICIGTGSVARNAKQYKTLFQDELIRVIIHGVLHLLGYDDGIKESREQMKIKEDFYLEVFRDLNDE